MCLILFAHNFHPDYSLILAANRDEYYQRPTLPLAFWEDEPNILAGRDLEAKGTWLGISLNGRLGALTNFRDTAPPDRNAPSRGSLVTNFLAGTAKPKQYLQQIRATGHRFNGFNLLVGDRENLYYYSNRGSDIHPFTPGIYGISTCLLGTQWPKISKGTTEISKLLSAHEEILPEDLLKLLQDRSCPPDDQLPRTGFNRERERMFAPLFIQSEGYGTRASSVILITYTGKVTFIERTFEPNQPPDESNTRRFEFLIS